MPPQAIKPGECISTLAIQHGIDPDTVWAAPPNAELRRARGDANVLAAGDQVDVPAVATKRRTVEANQRHVLQLSHTQVTLRLRLETAAGPMRDTQWVLDVGGRALEGKTDGDGLLEARVPAIAMRSGVSSSGTSSRATDREERQRLANLGYLASAATTEVSSALRLALPVFQRDAGLEATGDLDAPTIDALRERHGS